MKRKASKLLIFLVVFVDLLGFGIMIPMLPFYVRFFEASAFQMGWLMAIYSIFQILMSPYWGQLSDKFGRRPILLITIGGQAAAFLLAGLAGSYWILFLSRALAGAFGANITTASAYMADITSKEDRAKGMGLIGAAFGLGFVFGPAVGGILIPYGYDLPSYAAAIFSACNLLLCYLVLAEPLKESAERVARRRRVSFSVIRKTLKQPEIFFPILIFFLFTFSFVQLEINFGYFVLDQFHYSERVAAWMLAGFGFLMAIVQGGLVGRLAKKFGESKLILLGSAGLALGFGALFFVKDIYEFVGALVLMALAYSLANPCLSALVSKSAKASEQGSALGVYQSGGSLARAMAPLAAGFLYDKHMKLPFVLGCVLLSSAVFIWYFWSRKKLQEPS